MTARSDAKPRPVQPEGGFVIPAIVGFANMVCGMDLKQSVAGRHLERLGLAVMAHGHTDM